MVCLFLDQREDELVAAKAHGDEMTARAQAQLDAEKASN